MGADVVLGEGSHADPAGVLAPAIREASRREGLEILVLVVGTTEDPQNLDTQIATLEDAGAIVVRTVREAIERVATRLVHPVAAEGEAIPTPAFEPPFAAINIGLETFHESLLAQGAASVQVDWRPPARGDERLLAILDRMR